MTSAQRGDEAQTSAVPQGANAGAETALPAARSQQGCPTLVALADRGAIYQYCRQLANALAKHTPCRVVIPQSAPVSGFSHDVDVRRVPAPLGLSLRELVAAPAHLLGFIRFRGSLRAEECSVVHFLHYHPWLTLAAPSVSERLAVTIHDPLLHAGERLLRKRIAGAAYRKYARHIFVHGQLLKEQLVGQCVPAARIGVIPLGVCAEREDAPAARMSETPTALFLGRILAYKGVDTLLAAADGLGELVEGFKLVIAGEGDMAPYREAVERAQRAGYLRVENRFLAEDEMRALIEQAWCVVLPYKEATQTGVAPVAFAAGRPVIATRVGAIPELVHDQSTGILVPPDEPGALRAAMARLLTDRRLAQTMGGAAREFAQRELSWEAVARRCLQVYSAIGHG